MHIKKLTNKLLLTTFGFIGIIFSFMSHAIVVQKSPNDIRTYAFLELDNGLKAIVVHDPQAIKSACSLEINVGSSHEPSDNLGLAHFLEHMMFLGTEKFPETDEFQKMLNHNGGSFNAYTASDRTHYFFDVQTSAFNDALERFAEFFKTPLFNIELMDRERKNVDSEFQMYLNQDGRRVYDVSKSTANPNHPFSRFSVGNLQTLGQEKDVLHEALLKFYKEHYSADRMTLALVGPDSIEQQIEWVKTNFKDIEKRETAADTTLPLYEKEQLNVDIHIEAKGNAREMGLSFVMPSFQSHYKIKPLYLLSYLLGYEGEGSLYDVFKKKGWITGLATGVDENPDSQDLLQFHFYLTPEGLKRVDDITAYTFKTIELLKKNGYPETFFNDVQEISRLAFMYLERQSETTLASDLANRLQEYTPEEVIVSRFFTTDVSFTEANKLINDALNYLTPSNVRRIVISPELKGDKETEWFKTSYRLAPLSSLDAIEKLDAPLSLPGPNPYIPENLSRQVKDQVQSAIEPNLIHDAKGMMLWHQNDARFVYPKADIFINLVNPLSLNSPKNQMISGLFAQLVMEKLNLVMYPAVMLGEEISFYSHARGMTIQFSGYSDKQDKLLNVFAQTLKDYQVDAVDFELFKERKIRELKNFDQLPPFRQAAMSLSTLFVSPDWHIEELLPALEEITIQDIADFKEKFMSDLKIEMLVNGNYSAAEAKKLSETLEKNIALNAQKTNNPRIDVYSLPKGKLRYHTLKTSDSNHALALYLQSDEASVEAIAKTLILSKLLMAPMYQNLRVEQQIGYALGVSFDLEQRVPGLNFVVQSPNVTPDKIYAALNTFWQKYATDIDQLADKDILPIQTSLVNELRDPPKILREQTYQFWPTIEKGRNEFDLREKIAQAVLNVSVNDIKAYYQTLILKQETGQVAVVSSMEEAPNNWQPIEDWQTLKKESTVFKF